jgi:hypothetical protein
LWYCQRPEHRTKRNRSELFFDDSLDTVLVTTVDTGVNLSFAASFSITTMSTRSTRGITRNNDPAPETGAMDTAWDQLMARIGMDSPTLAELKRYGITSLKDLERYKDEGIDRFCVKMMKHPHPNRPEGAVVFVSPTTQEQLKTIRYWIRVQRRTGQPLHPDNCNDDVLLEINNRMDELEDIKKAETSNKVERPDKLKQMSDWLTFYDSWLTYTTSIRGAADIPITYVFREEEEVSAAALRKQYISDDVKYYHITKLSGRHFAADSNRVWSEIKVLTHGGPGWDHIKQFKPSQDGRQAILALRKQALSTSGIEARKDRALDSLEDLVFDGPKKSWTLEKYINGHLRAHNELEECKEAVTESQKIRKFLNNITDPRLDQDIRYVRGRREEYDTFEKVQQYLLLVSSGDKGRHKAPRRVAGIQAGVVGNRSEAKKDTSKPGGKYNGKLEGKSYSTQEWRSMERWQQDKVRELRKKKAAGGKRKVAQVTEERNEPDTAEEPDDNAGKQFGRAAHHQPAHQQKKPKNSTKE